MSRRSARAAVAAAAVGSLLPLTFADPATAAITASCDPEASTDSTVAAGRTLESLQIKQVQDWFTARDQTAGQGVTVAVLDSGVAAVQVPPKIAVAGQSLYANVAGAAYYHGTAVAGIIAGKPDDEGNPIGIAPGASILDVKIYDVAGVTSTEGRGVETTGVMEGLNAVLAAAATTPSLKVVNASVSIADTPGMQTVINKLWRRGIIVVASSGNRSILEGDRMYEKFAEFEPGEDAAKYVYPAGYKHVVSAATTAEGAADPDPLSYILQNSGIDVAVPTAGAPSYSVSGGPCVLTEPATSWAAAEVSGVLAMLWSAYPDATPAQIVTRLEATASGRTDLRSPVTGAGVVQPYDALTRPLIISPEGKLDQTEAVVDQQKAEFPEPETDPLVSTRKNMVWFGVLGGGVLVLALVLRPVLARRRRTPLT